MKITIHGNTRYCHYNYNANNGNDIKYTVNNTSNVDGKWKCNDATYTDNYVNSNHDNNNNNVIIVKVIMK